MSNPPRSKPPEDSHVFDFAVELAGMKADSKGVKADLDSLDSRLGGLEQEMRRGFNALADSITRLTAPKGAPWQMISIMVVVGLALGSWANTYFGQGISAAHKALELAQNKQDAIAGSISTLAASYNAHAIQNADTAGYSRAKQEQTTKDLERLREELDKSRLPAKVGP